MHTNLSQTKNKFSVGYILSNIIFFIFIIYVIANMKEVRLAVVIPCLITSILSFYIVFNPLRHDLLEAIKFPVFLYGVSFGFSPIFLFDDGIYRISYLGNNWISTLEHGAILSMAGLFFLIFGYSIGGLITFKKHINRKKVITKQGLVKLKRFGYILLTVGFISYIGLLFKSGGISHFLSYKGGRADIFQNTFGGFYWGAFLLISGLCAIGVAIAKNHPYRVMILSLIIGLLFALFQGREQFIAPVFCGFVILHYGHKRFSAKKIGIYAIALLFLASIYGVYRGANKEMVYSNPHEFISTYFEKSDQYLKTTLSNNLEQLDSLLISIRYIEKTNAPLSGRSLMIWFSPLNRLFFNDYFELIHAGSFMDKLVNTQHRFSRTALSPSLSGELYLNFEDAGVLIGLLFYGALLRIMYAPLEYSNKPGVILALYPYALWNVGKMIIDGVGLLFKLITVITPLLVFYIIFKSEKDEDEI